MYPNGNNQIGAYGNPYSMSYSYSQQPQNRQDMYRVQIENLQQQLDMLKSMLPQPQPVQPAQQPIQQNELLTTTVIPIKNEEEAYNWSVDVGKSQMFMTEDEQVICIKEVFPNNQFDFSVYKKQEATEKPKMEDMSEFVRKDQLKEFVLSIMTGKEMTK